MNNVPWLNIVRFHTEIVKRAEQSFFSFNPKDDQGDRWTSIGSIDETDLVGPWRIPISSVRSAPFRRAIESGTHPSIFLGGPCFVGRQKVGNNYQDRWQPTLYREVTIVEHEEEWELVPASGVWAGSGPFLQEVGRKEAFPATEMETLATRLVEKASHYGKDGSAVRRAIEALLPELEPVMKLQLEASRAPAPSSWVLFAPSREFSPYVRHLLRDYEVLTSQLEKPEANLGGLAILEGKPCSRQTRDAGIMPLVPLNESQERAVRGMLSGDPLTVVSGPPGCGKSQVVVSLLLNAWAQGLSVLFASNNNRAVDVVRERLERFENELPVCVRAGSREMSRASDTLRRVLQEASMPDRSGREQSDRARAKLIQRKAVAEQALATHVPQRIDEALRAAFRLYGERSVALGDIQSREGALNAELRAAGVHGWSFEEAAQAVDSTRGWIESAGKARAAAKEDRRRAEAETSAAAEYRRVRDAALAAAGWTHSSDADLSWLAAGPAAIDRWVADVIELLQRPLEDDLRESTWESAWDRWRDSQSAEAWSKRAEAISQAIRRLVAESRTVLDDIDRRMTTLDAECDRVRSTDIPPDVEVADELLVSWIAAWTRFSNVPPKWHDVMPWSAKAMLRRELERCEVELYRVFPPAFWATVGQLTDAGRRALSERLQLCRSWLRVRGDRVVLEGQRRRVTDEFARLRAELAELSAELVPATDMWDEWSACAEALRSSSAVAVGAAAGWRAKERAVAVRFEVSRAMMTWSSSLASIPIAGAWRTSFGAQADGVIRRAAADVTIEAIRSLRDIFHSGIFQGMSEAWSRAARADASARESLARSMSILSEQSHLAAWRADRPARALIETPEGDSWPDEGNLRAELRAKVDVLEQWRDWVDVGRPAIQSQADRTLTEAIGRLKEALELYKTCEDSSEAEVAVGDAQARPEAWQEEELRRAFARTDPARLKATIEGIDRDLERGSFAEAKQRWRRRMRDDRASQEAVGQLLNRLATNQGQLSPNDADVFRQSLQLVPIWITTAQAAQAIPMAAELFDIVVIDEASQCTLTNLLPLLYRGKRLVVIGDGEQLPAIPTIQAPEEHALASKFGISDYVSRFGHASVNVYDIASRVHPFGPAGTLMLIEHYRSHPLIIGFANKHIYRKALQLRREMSAIPAAGVFKHHVQGKAEKTRRNEWINNEEAKRVIALMKEVSSQRLGSIGVVTPFRGQKNLIEELKQQERDLIDVKVDTAHGFQGDERNVMIFSPVVAPGIMAGSVKFVETPHNLVNVALTRARMALHVVADFKFLMSLSGILKDLSQYCNNIDTLRKTSEEELLLFGWMVANGMDPSVHPTIGDLEVDFVLERPGCRVVVEVDGRQHENTRAADAARDSFLRARGYGVVRLPTVRVREEPFQCLDEIRRALDDDQRSTPTRSG